MTPDEGFAIVDFLVSAYPREDIPPKTVMIYVACLADYSFEKALKGASDCITECDYFPRVSVLRRAILAADPGCYLPDAAVAWAEVMTQLRESGFESPKFSHPAIGAAVKAIGWRNLCNSHEIGVDRAHFLKIYESYRNRCFKDLVNLPASTIKGLNLSAQVEVDELPLEKAMKMINSVAKSKGA